jgi:hypothetical protein
MIAGANRAASSAPDTGIPPCPAQTSGVATTRTGQSAVGYLRGQPNAVRAFRKQSQETSDQAKMLKVQSDRLEGVPHAGR